MRSPSSAAAGRAQATPQEGAPTRDRTNLCEIGGVVRASAVGAVPRPDDRVGHHQRNVVGVAPADAFHGDRDVAQRHRVVAHSHLRS